MIWHDLNLGEVEHEVVVILVKGVSGVCAGLQIQIQHDWPRAPVDLYRHAHNAQNVQKYRLPTQSMRLFWCHTVLPLLTRHTRYQQKALLGEKQCQHQALLCCSLDPAKGASFDPARDASVRMLLQRSKTALVCMAIHTI